MDCETHLFMAKVIVREVNRHLPVPLAENAFILSSFLGDYTPYTLMHKHTAARSMDWICEQIEQLAVPVTLYELLVGQFSVSIRLGLICHYICDFFCRAHAVDGPYGDLRVHLQYEDFLASYAKTWADSLESRPWNVDGLNALEPSDITGALREREAAYRQRGQSVEDDMYSAISNSIQMVFATMALRERSAAPVPALRPSYNLAAQS